MTARLPALDDQADHDDEILWSLPDILNGLWQPEGLCTNPELNPGIDWFPPPQKPARAAKAIAICQTCPVQTECLLYALNHGIRDGIWGGLSAKKRDRFRHQLSKLGLAMPLRICHWCQRAFPVTILSSNAKYCTPAHRTLARHRRRRGLEANR